MAFPVQDETSGEHSWYILRRGVDTAAQCGAKPGGETAKPQKIWIKSGHEIYTKVKP